MLTRIDGDGRGGAALSMRAVTGKPIKLIGVGEKSMRLRIFIRPRIADRILGMGDILSLVEKAAETIDQEQAAKLAKRMQKGAFDLEDFSEQLKQMAKLGGMSGIMGMMPGIGKMKKQMSAANIDDGMINRQIAIISSMTRKERQQPKILNASRKKRIAAGSGTQVQEINRLIKTHRQMADMMKMMGKKKGLLGGLFGGGMPDMDPAAIEEMQKSGTLPKGLPPGMGGGLGGGMPGLGGPGMPKLPGLGSGLGRGPGGLPGLPGGFTKKK